MDTEKERRDEKIPCAVSCHSFFDTTSVLSDEVTVGAGEFLSSLRTLPKSSSHDDCDYDEGRGSEDLTQTDIQIIAVLQLLSSCS